jgi:hypothetical protein
MTVMWVTILLPVLTACIGFAAGVRYCRKSLLPGLLARMTPEELSELAADAYRERRQR